MAPFYFFLLGLSAGLTVLTISAYRSISPPWLKWLLVGAGFFIISRYAAMSLFASSAFPQQVWSFRYCWFATSLGFPLLAAYAVDQLIRHPAMTPKRLLTWLSPLLAIYAIIIVFAPKSASPDPVSGWAVHLSPGWQRVLGTTHLFFTAAFVTCCVQLFIKIPSTPIRIALAGLMAGFGLMATDGLLSAMGVWYFRPYLFSEMAMLVALWHAFETASTLQRA